MAKLYLSRSNKLVSVITLLCLLSFLYSSSQPVLSRTAVITGLSSPIQLVNAGDGSNRIFIVQQGGVIRAFSGAYASLGNFLTVSGISTGGERGLLSMVFHPDYENNGYFFVYYTNTDGNLEIARYHVNGDPTTTNVADASSKTIVLTIGHPGQSNHNGGTLNFGNDGYLYIATGDGGGGGDVPNNAQSGDTLLGKMLRIDVNVGPSGPIYSIPPTNPFVSAVDTLPEIFAFGLRNPFRWSFDPLTYDMWIGDVGQNNWEEINFREAGTTSGVNYGWRCYEGNAQYNISECDLGTTVFVSPVHVYPNPGSGSSSVTGGTVYRGTNPVNSALVGYYLASDFYSGNLYKIRRVGMSWQVFTQNGFQTNISNFGTTENGEIFTVSLTGNSVSQLTVSSVLPLDLTDFTATPLNRFVRLNWKTSYERDLRDFEVEYSTDAIRYSSAGAVPAQNAPNGASYQFDHTPPARSVIYYRVKMVNIDATYTYSPIAMVDLRGNIKQNFVYPSMITDKTVSLHLDQPFNTVELISKNGAIVFRKDIKGAMGRIDVPVPSLPGGIYIVQIKNAQTSLSQRVFIR